MDNIFQFYRCWLEGRQLRIGETGLWGLTGDRFLSARKRRVYLTGTRPLIQQADQKTAPDPLFGRKCDFLPRNMPENVIFCLISQPKIRFVMEKAEKYKLLAEQIKALIEGEKDEVAVMANVAAAIHQEMGFWWTGFYRVKDSELVLGPFQGPVACMHIPFGKGVCGSAWKAGVTIVVPDVEQFPGHIACSSESRSEIVVPIFSKKGEITGVLDIDSRDLATFDEVDKMWLEKIVAFL